MEVLCDRVEGGEREGKGSHLERKERCVLVSKNEGRKREEEGTGNGKKEGRKEEGERK